MAGGLDGSAGKAAVVTRAARAAAWAILARPLAWPRPTPPNQFHRPVLSPGQSQEQDSRLRMCQYCLQASAAIEGSASAGRFCVSSCRRTRTKLRLVARSAFRRSESRDPFAAPPPQGLSHVEDQQVYDSFVRGFRPGAVSRAIEAAAAATRAAVAPAEAARATAAPARSNTPPPPPPPKSE